jgi:hypothetical protein
MEDLEREQDKEWVDRAQEKKEAAMIRFDVESLFSLYRQEPGVLLSVAELWPLKPHPPTLAVERSSSLPFSEERAGRRECPSKEGGGT